MMTEQEVAIRIICAFLGALCIINMFTKVIGPERKQQWFTVRSGWFVFLNYRGSLTKDWLYGTPKTIQGVGVALLMAACIALETWVIFLV
ncbi:MAG: hypothetical protein IIU21_05955 [Schwartzia sp.]|nr:hypothetical protein [Schwartzia sp. (in: firmicutes)]